MFKFIIFWGGLIATVAGESCSPAKKCDVCLADRTCSYVLARLQQDETKYMCMNNFQPQVNGVTVLSRVRTIEGCGSIPKDDATDNEDDGEEFGPAEEMMMVPTNKSVCPIATPLMVAFIITLLLLAIILTAVVTVACWVSCCGTEDGELTGSSRKASREEIRNNLESTNV